MRNEIIVEKLLMYTEKVLDYCRGFTYTDFCENTMAVEACVFNLSQMGELANKADSSYIAGHPEVPWRYLYGLRNRIVHDYEGVNLRLIWEIISEDLEPLRAALEAILEKESPEDAH